MEEELTVTGVASRVVAQPGKFIVGVPPFVFVMPKGWVLDAAPGALAVFRLGDQTDGFWVNALLNHDKVARAVDFKMAAKVTWAKLQRSGVTDLTDQGERMMRFGNLAVYVRGCEFTSNDRKLAQMHAIWFAPVEEGGKVVDMFQLVLTAPTSIMAAAAKSMLETVSTFRFT